jgi:hypothetical protein
MVVKDASKAGGSVLEQVTNSNWGVWQGHQQSRG